MQPSSSNKVQDYKYSTPNSKNPDFSKIDTLGKVQQLEQEGKLEKILLFPKEFGGEDISHNIVYVPIGIGDIKQKITNTLINFVKEGLISNMEVLPEYKGNSFVPARITIKTSNENKPGLFNTTINIW
jgi:hypothetical protein